MNRINIALIGGVSAGKSTFANALFVEQYSDMKIKRTTALPQVYHETDEKISRKELNSIREQNRKLNNDVMNKTANGNKLEFKDIYEREYKVPKVYDLVNLKENVYLSIYDIPGLNDSQTKNVYYQYVKQNFYKFDIIIFVVAIESALNTSDEIDILEMILRETKNNNDTYGINTKIMVLINKCDEMEFNKTTKETIPQDEELLEMREQVINILNSKKNEIYPEADIYTQCISCEDTYMYRTLMRNPEQDLDIKYINKFGMNEYGRSRWMKLTDAKKKKKILSLFKKNSYKNRIELSGFLEFKTKLQNILSPLQQYKFICNHIKIDIEKIPHSTKLDITDDIKKFTLLYNRILKLNVIFSIKNTENINLNNILYNKLLEYETEYAQYNLHYVTHTTFNNEIINNMYNKIILCFNGLIDKKCAIYDNHKIIKDRLNTEYLKSINNKASTAYDIIMCCKMLEKNDYDVKHKLQRNYRTLSNSILYNIHSYDIYFKGNDKIKYDFVLKLMEYFAIDEKGNIEILLKNLLSYHSGFIVLCNNILDIPGDIFINYTQTKNILKTIQLKTTNPFYDTISKLNLLVELIHRKYLEYNNYRHIDDFLLNNINDTKHFVLVSKIIELITKYYPTDIVKTDDLIDMYHNYVKFSHQSNDIKVIDNNSENELSDNNSENKLSDNDSEDSLSDELNNELNTSDSDISDNNNNNNDDNISASIDDDNTDSDVEPVSTKTKKKVIVRKKRI